MFGILSGHGSFCLSRAFIGAVLIIYLTAHGIDFSTIAIAKSLQLATSVILNYPAGKIADRLGKKTAILLACISQVIYFSLMINPSNLKVLLGEAFNGLGIALYAGAYEAWIFTHKDDNEDSFSLVTRSAEVLFIVTIISGVIGAYFSGYSFFMSIGFMLISFVVYVFTPEKRTFVLIQKEKSNKSTRNGIMKLMSNMDANIILFFIVEGLMQLVYQFWPLYFSQEPFSFSQKQIGYVFAISMGFQWMVTFIARKLNLNRLKNVSSILLLSVFILSTLTILCPMVYINGAVPVLIYSLFLSTGALTSSYYFAKSCDIFESRSDETSMISLLDAGGRCVGAIILGIVSVININTPYLVWSIFPIVMIIIPFTVAIKRQGSHGL